MPDPRAAKAQLRADLRARLAALAPDQVAARSAQIAARIEAHIVYAAASSILLFVPMAARPEVDLQPFIRRALAAGKRIALPRVNWSDRSMAAHFILNLDADLEPDTGRPAAGLQQPRATCRPARPASIDLLLVPGLGFDSHGGRIGHGAGFYDRFLAQPDVAKRHAPACGVGFEAQLLPPARSLPLEPHDRPLNLLFTEARTLSFLSPSGSAHRGPD